MITLQDLRNNFYGKDNIKESFELYFIFLFIYGIIKIKFNTIFYNLIDE